MKISSSKIKKLTSKGMLKSITDKGILIETDEGDELVEFNLILEHFENLEVKLEIIVNVKSEEEI